MKKILALSIVALLALNVSAQRGWANAPKDNTGRNLTLELKTPTSAATYTLAPRASKTYVKMTTLAADLGVTAIVTSAKVCDELVFIFVADGSARTVTFNAGLVPSATMVVDASSKATVSFVFDGTAFIETGRAKE